MEGQLNLDNPLTRVALGATYKKRQKKTTTKKTKKNTDNYEQP
jgi:hypothetical protein